MTKETIKFLISNKKHKGALLQYEISMTSFYEMEITIYINMTKKLSFEGTS